MTQPPHDYPETHEHAEPFHPFQVAITTMNIASLFIGVAVILGLFTVLISMLNWVYSDILHSILFIFGL